MDDVQADCEFNVKFGADHEHHKCVCKTGWTGNGVQVSALGLSMWSGNRSFNDGAGQVVCVAKLL